MGKALFNAIFEPRVAQRIFDNFQDSDDNERVLTINTQLAEILALPWELLHDPTQEYLFWEKPPISIRRKITGNTSGRQPAKIQAKAQLHLLFVVSRPILQALDDYAPGRVTWEFLRPATLNALVERLADETLPAIDILHFDGHGTFRQVTEQDAKENPTLFGKSRLRTWAEICCGLTLGWWSSRPVRAPRWMITAVILWPV